MLRVLNAKKDNIPYLDICSAAMVDVELRYPSGKEVLAVAAVGT
jgi:hypothetical protein